MAQAGKANFMGCALELVLQHYLAFRSSWGLVLKAAYSWSGPQNAMMSIIFTLYLDQQRHRGESICLASRGFPCQSWEWSLRHFSTVNVTSWCLPSRRSIIMCWAYRVRCSFPATVLAIHVRDLNPALWQGWGCWTVPWALSQLQHKMQTGNCD